MCVGPRAPLVYTKEQLLALRSAAVSPRDRHEIPADLLKKTRRGCRAGRKLREKKRRFRPVLPSVIMGNVRSLSNKTDELAALTRYQREYRDTSLMLFTETWLTTHIPDSAIAMDNFHLLRADRTAESGKKKGGGLAVFVNEKWCKPGHCVVKEQRCNKDIELLAVSMRPYYLPREFTHVIVIAVYVPPSANAETACETLLSCTSTLQTQHPQALFLISGDFNHSSPASVLPTFTQYVTCLTRDNKTLDLFFVNAKEAYSSSALPPLGRADHNIVHLRPVYQPIVHRQPVVSRVVKRWSPESEEALRDCFDTTVWTELCDPHGEDINAMTECITDYINFCFENTVPSRTVRCFSNNKPWINPDIKALLKEKKRAFKSGNKEGLRTAQKKLRRKIRRAKAAYRRRMEQQLQNQNISAVWRSLKHISGFKPPPVQTEGDQQWVNELNSHFLSPAHHYTWTHPSPQYTTPCPSSVCHSSPGEERAEKDQNQEGSWTRLHQPRLLKSCADELCGVMGHVFNMSLKLRVVPQLWKTSCVVPVPKTPHAKDLSSFRPVALTSHLMKTLERLVLGHLRSTVSSALDPLQFAYRPGIGVEDAVIFLLHRSLSHLEKPGCAVRILFFDFSSAFNTIQPLLLRDKLETAGVDCDLAEWILDYLTNRPQFVRARDYFRHNTDSCVLQKFSDDSAIIGLITDDDDAEYRGLTQDFVDWCQQNHLLLNAGKTKEMVVDFRRRHSIAPPPVNIQGRDIERVDSYNTWSRLYLLRRLRSFGVRGPLLRTFYDSVVASAILYGVVCWSSSITERERKKLDKVIKKSSSVLGCPLDSVREVGDRRVLARFTSMLDHESHPLQDALSALESSFSDRLIHPRCVKERFRRSFLPAAVRLYNEHC
ncbi:hypothetical protein WMY93_013504 [Mugilogobius chulae]|uniref:Reverse transcriptase domain-containing protein n=1 Tax=Mugilogobius chulae TaxID=88201 RepID=A0AAW0P0F5_9GOBI